jgi:hypothetical protein
MLKLILEGSVYCRFVPAGGAAVAGNTAVTTPVSTVFETDVAPATVKKFAATPVRVYPVLAVSVMVAV